MQAAEVISDINSLLICDGQSAAVDLISTRSRLSNSTANASAKDGSSSSSADIEPALHRAYKLLRLYGEIKDAYSTGDASGELSGSANAKALDSLQAARHDVAQARKHLGLGVPTEITHEITKHAGASDSALETVEDETNDELADDDLAAWS